MKFKFIKKDVMFGLDNQKKENCHPELGWLKPCRLQLDAGSHEVNAKHGAMFGLDARIALAIFGALSVISGAALYSAIQNATAVKWQVYFNELTKATEAYYLDNGKKLPYSSSGILYLGDLLNNRENLKTWNGPYWQGEPYSASNLSQIKDSTLMSEFSNSSMGIRLYQADNWSGSPSSSAQCIVNDINCSKWLILHVTSSVDKAKILKIFNLLDEKIDNGDGALSGSIRTYDFGLVAYLYYKSSQYTKRS